MCRAGVIKQFINMVKIIDVKSKPSDMNKRCEHFVKYLYNGIYFEGIFTQYYIDNKGLKDIIKENHYD